MWFDTGLGLDDLLFGSEYSEKNIAVKSATIFVIL